MIFQAAVSLKKKKSNALGPQVMGYLKGTEQFNSITYISLTKF